MTGQPYQAPPANPLQPAVIIYILYFVGFAFGPIALGGVIYAYIEKGKDPVLDTHLNFQIQTFWIGVVMLVVGFVLSLVLIGWLVLLFWVVWTIVRCITGIQLAQAQQPITAVEMVGMKAI